MKKIKYLSALFVIILAFFTFQNSFSQVNQEWAERYNGPADSTDWGYSITYDDSGNVYVTGYSFGIGTSYDYLTIKYNSAGVQQWSSRYNRSGNSSDYSNSIAVDGSGNVYVTGRSYLNPQGTNSDYATVKYNSSGVLQWSATYNGPGNSFDGAYSIALDCEENVYVTGSSNGSGSFSDYATIKYNSAGIQQWVARYNGSGNDNDHANSIKVDILGNVYVTGKSVGIGTSYDYLTVKYNSSGVMQWESRYNGPGYSGDYAISITLDDSGNVYVTGNQNNGQDIDYATLKYNSAGVEKWVARYNGPANSSDYAVSITADNSGNVFVTGQSYGIGTHVDYATIKYNSAGEEQWVNRYNGTANYTDNAVAMDLDHSGNIYVTGNSYDTLTSSDYTTIKYNSDGTQQWVTKYNGTANSDDVGFSIAIDDLDNVYVTGVSMGIGTGADYATIKYSQTTGIEQIYSELPEQFSLSQNYPNPFNPSTIINYQLSMINYVSLKVYDALGREVATLVNEKQNPGTYQVEFDGSGLTSGVYFYKLTAGEFTDTKRMFLVK
ncbi:MAG: SBBP repeat-containing protein [Ignavibacteria bacterium]|nr:SBBP repeat-containing protein [Ignavibacteria bacterium]